MRKATGPDRNSPRLLRDCADDRCGVFQHIVNIGLGLGRVPILWKTSCVVPVPKTAHPREPNHFRPVALTPHLMKALERIVLNHLRCPKLIFEVCLFININILIYLNIF